MNKILASVFIICKNEEKHIGRVLENTKDFDEVILVDSGSSDKTLEIAKNYPCKIYHQDWLGFSKQKEYAKNLCTNKWVLSLDADEVITDVLKNEIITTIDKNDCDGLYIKLNTIFINKFRHPWSGFNDRIKFFKKSKGYFQDRLVHETVRLNGKTKKAKGFILDYGTNDLKTQVDKTNSYSSLRAEEKIKKNKKYSLLKIILVFPIAWMKSFVLKLGFLNGTRGFINAINVGYYAFLKEAKLYEKNMEKISNDDIVLTDNLLLGEGRNRKCYLHPNNENICIKISSKKGERSAKREKAYLTRLKKQNKSLEMIADFIGEIDTNLGNGDMYQLIRDSDGKISKSLEYYLKDKKMDSYLIKLIERLRVYLLKENILFSDFGLRNILIQEIGDNDYKLVVIDGIGDNNQIPFLEFLKPLGLKRNIKKWNVFKEEVKKIAPILSDSIKAYNE